MLLFGSMLWVIVMWKGEVLPHIQHFVQSLKGLCQYCLFFFLELIITSLHLDRGPGSTVLLAMCSVVFTFSGIKDENLVLSDINIFPHKED